MTSPEISSEIRPDPAPDLALVPDPALTWSGIVFCPVCATPIDVVGQDGLIAELECESCGQGWSMPLDLSRIETHGH